MAVVQVGHMGVGVNHRLVPMQVLMTGRYPGRMNMGMVPVVVHVLVVVFDRVVGVLVNVLAVHHEAHTEGSDHE